MTWPPSPLVLLGAGASAEAGVPPSFAMTRSLIEKIDERFDRISHALNFVCATLIGYDGAAGISPFENLDVERVFAAVQLLAERHDLEVTPFVSAWHPKVDELDRTLAGRRPASLTKRFRAALDEHSDLKLARVLGEAIDARTSTRATGQVYEELAGHMIDALRIFIYTDAGQTTYLRPLIERAAEPGGLTVATLNYDLTVEQAATAHGVQCDTGIAHWLSEGRWSWAEEGVRLIKLHGSHDWSWGFEERRDGYLPHREMHVGSVNADLEPVLVFGQRAKLQADGPFLSLLGEFERLLAESRSLIVIGYSFRDEHVNEVIRRWTAEDAARTIVVVDPNWPEDFPSSSDDFRVLLDRHLMPSPFIRGGPTFEPRLSVLRHQCSDALELFRSPHPFA